MPTWMEMMESECAHPAAPERTTVDLVVSATPESYEHPLATLAAGAAGAAFAGCLLGFALAWRAARHDHAARVMVA